MRARQGWRRGLAGLACVALAACGGGGDTQAPTPGTPSGTATGDAGTEAPSGAGTVDGGTQPSSDAGTG
ncbi:hypothetical protein ACLEQD_20345, partial [Corallococcus sp. 4LFB]